MFVLCLSMLTIGCAPGRPLWSHQCAGVCEYCVCYVLTGGYDSYPPGRPLWSHQCVRVCEYCVCYVLTGGYDSYPPGRPLWSHQCAGVCEGPELSRSQQYKGQGH